MDRELSTLELTALGIVWKKGPCTAYSVMKEFAGSQTLAYRSGAGSIYPLLKRLRSAGLMAESNGMLTITSSGEDSLRQWAKMDSKLSFNLDPLRSRVYFLAILAHADQREFIEKALASLKDLLRDAKSDVNAYRESGQMMSALAMQGAVYETEARIKFMKDLERELMASVSLSKGDGSLPG